MSLEAKQADANTPLRVPEELKEAYSLISAELLQVTDLIRTCLSHENPQIDNVLQYAFQFGGKRLRPLLVLLSGLACGGIQSTHCSAAAALELIHTGTLIHDDILDGARFRRHLETFHIRWDSKTAVLAGDFLLISAIQLMTSVRDLEAYALLAEACGQTCEGELCQTRNQGRIEMGIDEYNKIIAGKTAALLRCSCHLGAHFAGASDEISKKFANFGFQLGMAFQIIDDILDLTGTEEATGKTLGTDLINRKPTLPLIFYLQDASESEQAEMYKLLETKEITSDIQKNITDRLIGLGSVNKAFEYANQLLQNALERIRKTKPVEAGPLQCKAFDALADVARFVIKRRN